MAHDCPGIKSISAALNHVLLPSTILLFNPVGWCQPLCTLPRDSFLRGHQQVSRITTTWISSIHYLKRSMKFYFTHRHTYAGKKNMENIVMIFATIRPYTNQFLYNCSHCCISTLLYWTFFLSKCPKLFRIMVHLFAQFSSSEGLIGIIDCGGWWRGREDEVS